MITFDQPSHPYQSIFYQNDGVVTEMIAHHLFSHCAYPEKTLNRKKLENTGIHHALNVIAHAPGTPILQSVAKELKKQLSNNLRST